MAVYTVRASDDVGAKLDAMGGKRSDHLRAAIEGYANGRAPASGQNGAVPVDVGALHKRIAELEAEVERLKGSKPAVRKPYVPAKGAERWAGDDEAVLGLLDRPKGERTVEMELGWLGLRTGRALARLLSAGEIVCEGGLYRRVE